MDSLFCLDSPLTVFLSTAAAAGDGAIEAPAKLSRDWSRTALPHECPHCGQGFTRRSRLREHVFQHTGEKLFNCKICKKSFPTPANLLRHNLTHGGSRIFSCPLCDKRFFQPTSLKRHMLIHQGKPQERRVRGRGKGRGQSSDGRLHICPECPASFKFESQLKSHRSVCVLPKHLNSLFAYLHAFLLQNKRIYFQELIVFVYTMKVNGVQNPYFKDRNKTLSKYLLLFSNRSSSLCLE